VEIALERKLAYQLTRDKAAWWFGVATEFRKRVRGRNDALDEGDREKLADLHQPPLERVNAKITEMIKQCQVCGLLVPVSDRVLMSSASRRRTARLEPPR
jgi:hypothetical protein